MNIIFAHANDDKHHAAAITHWMGEQGFWVETWPLAADDSLLFRSRNGLWPADRLIVALSPAALEARWIRRELATRMSLDMLGALVNVPILSVLLKPCDVPPLLQSRIDADFIDKPFESACEELYRACIYPFSHRDTVRV